MLRTDLHVVETGERFVTDRARELSWSNKDLLSSRDPISAMRRSGRRFGSGGGKANVEGNCYSGGVIRVRVFLMSTQSRSVFWVKEFGFVVARRAKGEGNGIFIAILVSFKAGTITATRGHAGERVCFLHGDMVMDSEDNIIREREK